jgi:glycosyltransferase involved in cell wall biosynthesis
MRLLLVMEETRLGGAELSFLELALALAVHCDVHLMMNEVSAIRFAATPVFKTLQQHPITLHLSPVHLNPGTLSLLHPAFRRAAARQVTRLLDALKPDGVLVNLPTVERGQAVIDAIRRAVTNPPVWGLLHLSHPPTILGAKLGVVRDLGVRALLGRFDRLLTVSHSGARQVVERYGLGLPDVLYPPTKPLRPVCDAGQRAGQRREAGLPESFLLGVIGRIQLHHKGQDVALRTLTRLLQAGHDLRLVVIGDGPDDQALRQLADQLGIIPKVIFLGWRNDTEKLIPLLDAVVVPSRFEGLPQIALQSATARVPVIGYAVDGLTELLPPEFQVRFGDEAGLAQAVEGLLTGRLHWPHQAMQERASAWGDPGAAAERLLALLEEQALTGR